MERHDTCTRYLATSGRFPDTGEEYIAREGTEMQPCLT
jgi:hypothetical protein